MRDRSPELAIVLAAATLCACVSLEPYELAVDRLAEGEFLEIDGVTVHLERAGAASAGSPVVLVHGFGASSHSWRHVLPILAQSHPVVAVDLAGFGLTERPREKSRYSRAAQVDLLSELLDRLGWSSAHFVGHSYGGGLAMSLALTEPEKVRSLVLVSSTDPAWADSHRFFLAVPPLGNLFVRTRLRPGSVRRSLMRSVYDDEAVTEELVAAYLDRVKIEGVIRAFFGLTRPARPDPRFDDVSYEQLDQSVLLVWGADDVVIEPWEGRAGADQMPHARFVEIPECGHLPMEEQPELLAAQILPFLQEMDGELRIAEERGSS